VKLLVRDASVEGKESVAGALRNLARGDATNKAAIFTAGGIPPLVKLLRGGSDKCKKNAAGALRNLANGKAANRAAIFTAGGTPLLMALLRYGGFAEGRRNAAGALYKLMLHDAGRRQVAGLGYTQDQLNALLDR
jgi:hypothetical protein